MYPSSPLFKANTSSSKQWLARHFKDPYVKRRMLDNPAFRSRSAYKLLEMDDKYHFLRGFRYHKDPPKHRPNVVIDLGAAPGGWSQVVAFKTGHPTILKTKSHKPEEKSFGLKERVKGPRDDSDSWSDGTTPIKDGASSSVENSKKGLPTIIALDLHRMDKINGVISLQADFLSPVAEVLIQGNFPDEYKLQSVDLILSDMAANTTGNRTVDNANSIRIATSVFQFACRHLTLRNDNSSGGAMILKHFQHPDSVRFWQEYLKPSFCYAFSFKPPSSRSESSERYWVCMGFLGYRGPFVPPDIQPVEIGQMDLRGAGFGLRRKKEGEEEEDL